MPIPIAPLEEQNRIVLFLQERCAEIEKVASDVQAQIETLEQYKRSVITEAVTKGLNPNVPMRITQIEWAERIPAHWATMQNKYLMQKIKHVCPVYDDSDIISLTMNGVIVRDLDAGIKNNGLTSPAYSQFIMKSGNSAEYYYYYYLMLDFTKELLHLAKNLRHSFTEEQLGNIETVVPPIEEQRAIATFLDAKCAEIDAIIDGKRQQLAVLEEYKKSLIFEYVTGKKEVP